jgi:hypothetical protein
MNSRRGSVAVQLGRPAFEPLAPFVAAKQAAIETAGALFGGARVWMLLKINRPDAVIVPSADDRVSKYILDAVTQYLTHERGRSADTRLNNAWIAQSGPNARALPAAVDTFLKAAA